MLGEEGSSGVSANEYSCAHHVTLSPNKLWRSTSIFDLCCTNRKSSPNRLFLLKICISIGAHQMTLQEKVMPRESQNIRKMGNAFYVNIIRGSSHLWVNRKHGPTEKKLKKVLFLIRQLTGTLGIDIIKFSFLCKFRPAWKYVVAGLKQLGASHFSATGYFKFSTYCDYYAALVLLCAATS